MAVPDDPSKPRDEEFSVRLTWPKSAVPEPEAKRASAPAIPAPPGAPSAPPARVRAEPARAEPAGAEPVGSDAAEAKPRVREARSPAEGLGVTPTEGVPPGKVFVEAFDRLADRLLDRLRTLRQDVDADLGAVRTELASLRQAVDDLGDRTQLRQVQATVDEVRTELGALRRAVLDWPELEQVSNDIATVRGDLAFMFESAGDGSGVAPPSHLLEELQRTIGTLSDEITRLGREMPQIAAMNAVLEEVSSVRSELSQVRRRMTLRSGPLDEAQLEQVVTAVAARVVSELEGADGRRRRR